MFFISSWNRSQKAAHKAASSSKSFGSTRVYLLGCIFAFISALAIGYSSQLDTGLHPSGPEDAVIEDNLKDLMKAIHDALPKERRGYGPAIRSMQASFASLPKDLRGRVNAQGARYLLHGYFAQDGFKVQGLDYQISRPSSTQGLHDALVSGGIFQHTAPSIHHALRQIAELHGGFSLKAVGGMAAVIKAKQLSQSHVSAMIKLLYRQQNLSITQNVDIQVLQNMSDQYIAYVNNVNPFTQSVEPALTGVAALTTIKDRAMQHAHALKETEEGTSANSLSPNFSKKIVSLVLENLTDAFNDLYHSDHCSAMTETLTRISSKQTGRLRLSAFYSQIWNGTHNFEEPKRHLRLAGALDADAENNTAHVLIANYMQGPLNCIKQTQHYSLCCPNQCIALMQTIEASVRSPAAAPQKLLDTILNISFSSIATPIKISQELVTRLNEISFQHGGVVPLHGRLFAQWMHYTFPTECAYPQEVQSSAASPKTRLVAQDLTHVDAEEIAWAKVADTGFGMSAKMIQSSQWSQTEELPFQQAQTWHKKPALKQVFVRVVACIAMLGVLLHMTLKFTYCDDDKGNDSSALSAQQHAFKQQVQAKLEALRFEFNVEMSCGKHQEHMKVGMQLKPAFDLVGGIMVEGILPDGLMHLRNKAVAEGKRKYIVVQAGDRLISVNGETEAAKMIAELLKISSQKTTLRCSRDWSEAAPVIWTADLTRKRGEPWGMSISEASDSQNSKELTVSRVLSAGPVDKWNKRAIRKNTFGIYPGDVIIACNSELDVKKIFAKLHTEDMVTLTVLRWQAAQTEEKATGAKATVARDGVEKDTQSLGNTSVMPHVAPISCTNGDAGSSTDNADRTTEKKEDAQICSCCETVIGDRFLVMTCSAGEVNFYRRTCWRHKHGGFTLSHMPRRCSCGSPVAKLVVCERSSPTAEARVVHTILDGPMEVDISLEEAAQNQAHEERSAGSRRAASVTRRSIEGDARKRASSSARRARFDNPRPHREHASENDQGHDQSVCEMPAEQISRASRLAESSTSCKPQEELTRDVGNKRGQDIQPQGQNDEIRLLVATEPTTLCKPEASEGPAVSGLRQPIREVHVEDIVHASPPSGPDNDLDAISLCMSVQTSNNKSWQTDEPSACASSESNPKELSTEGAFLHPNSCCTDACAKSLEPADTTASTVVDMMHGEIEMPLRFSLPPGLPSPCEEAPIRFQTAANMLLPPVWQTSRPSYETIAFDLGPPPGLPPPHIEGEDSGFSQSFSAPQREVDVRNFGKPPGLLATWDSSDAGASTTNVVNAHRGRRWGRKHSEDMHSSG